MASKAIYTAVAVIGMAAASGAAWWYQKQPAKPREPAAEASRAAAAPAAVPARGASGAGAPRAPAVEVARVELLRIVDDAQAVGSLRSRQAVVLRPEVSGRITVLNFRDGERVKRGQLLVQLDDQLPVAQLKQAEAELSIARANHKRNEELVAQNFVSKRSLDESAANLQVAEAKLSLARATVQRLKIVAPFDGVTGIRTVNVGDYLKDGADIVNIEDLEAIFVDFRLPERFQTKVQRGQVASVEVDALPGRRFSAVIHAIDPLVDQNGRSVGLRGCIDNRQMMLRPGMFARVTPVFGVRDDARVIPEEAIVPQGGRQYVYKVVVGPDQDSRIAQRVEVKVGVRQPGKVEIVEGLQAGDLVVTAGQQRIQKDGTPVRVLDLSRPSGGGGPGGPGGAASAGSAGGGAGLVPGGGGAIVGGPAAAGPPAAAAPAPHGGRAGAGATIGGSSPVAGRNPCAVGGRA